jgi:hypothetical protein
MTLALSQSSSFLARGDLSNPCRGNDRARAAIISQLYPRGTPTLYVQPASRTGRLLFSCTEKPSMVPPARHSSSSGSGDRGEQPPVRDPPRGSRSGDPPRPPRSHRPPAMPHASHPLHHGSSHRGGNEGSSASAPAPAPPLQQQHHHSTGPGDSHSQAVPPPPPPQASSSAANLPRSVRNATPEQRAAIRKRQNVEVGSFVSTCQRAPSPYLSTIEPCTNYSRPASSSALKLSFTLTFLECSAEPGEKTAGGRSTAKFGRKAGSETR